MIKDKSSQPSGSKPVESGGPVDAAGVANGGGKDSTVLPLPSPDFFSSPFFTERGISPEVAAGRPYGLWNTTQELRDYFAPIPGASKTFIRNVSNQSPTGIIIGRSFRGMTIDNDDRFRAYLPELKPNGDKDGLGLDGEKFNGIRPSSLRGDRRFYHAHPTTKRSFPPKLTNGKKLSMMLYHSADHMRGHIKRDKFPGDHADVNNEYLHWHLEDPAKYAFLPGEGVAARLDVHPMAPRFSEARRVYIGMEGCPKADSILTAILATGEQSSVCSVPSVTLWNAKELDDLAFLFLMKTVDIEPLANGGALLTRAAIPAQIVLVPDADGYLNTRVRQQALFFRSRLRGFGLNVVIAAPPIPEEIRSQGKEVVKRWLETEGSKGVDDFLASGGKLAELDVLHRELPVDAFDAWALEQKFKYRLREDRIRRDCRFLEGLSLHGEDDGTFSGSLRSLAAAVGFKSHNSAYRAAHALVTAGELGIDRWPLSLAQKTWEKVDKKTGKGTGEWVTSSDFFAEDRPTFTLPAHLRCKPDSFHPLGPPKEDTMTTSELADRFVEQSRDLYLSAMVLKDRLPDDQSVADAVDVFVADALSGDA